MARVNNNAKFCRTWISDEEFFSAELLDGEVWKFFSRYKGIELSGMYGVSNKGRVRRQDGSIMRGSLDQDGYHHVSFSVKGNPAKSIGPAVHSVVLYLFVGDPPTDMKDPTTQHLNHDKLDNRVENLCWMSRFDNNQEGHGTRIKVIDQAGEHIFASHSAASKYIGRQEGYIADCIRYNYRATNISGQDVDVFTEVDGQWVQYCRTQPGNRHWCRIIQDNQTFDFESFQACDKFLGEEEGYVSNCVANSWPICNKPNFTFYIHGGERYAEYVPTKKRWKASRRCQIILSDGQVIRFKSISAAARYIGKDSEYVRINSRESRPIRDTDGNIVNLSILDEEEIGRVKLMQETSKKRLQGK